MARFALYGSTGPNEVSSKPISKSDSFNVSAQKSAFKNAITPAKLTTLDRRPQDILDKNVYLNYTLSSENIAIIRRKLHKTLNILDDGAQKTFTKYTRYYNRFKIPTLNDAFQKGFAHVFFVRPDCNILKSGGRALNESFMNDPEFYYCWKNNPDMVRQLTLDNGQSHDFMLSLSNKAASFSLNDEFINTDVYGKTFKGWQVAYGRNNVESKSASDFTISFNDDRTLHIYQIHKLWVDYISDVYQGKKSPKSKYILDKVIDYASACYYIITAEDGETIVFWSKYYGVFPSTIPSNQWSWNQGNNITAQPIDIKYQYSFKEDMNPEALVEFNMNANVNSNMSYVPTYDSKLGHVGTTWVGAPYIELVTNNTDPECPYTFKLRFQPAE